MLYQFMAKDIEMLQAFIKQSNNGLQKIEDAILQLENNADYTETLSNIAREVHTVKGLSSFFSMAEVTGLSHQVECILDAMCKGKIAREAKVAELLMNAKDALSGIILQLSVACEGTLQGEDISVELSCSYDIDTLIDSMQCFLDEIINVSPVKQVILPQVPVTKKTKKQDKKKNITPVLSTSLDVQQSDAEVITILLDGVAKVMMEDFLLEADEHSTIITDSLLIALDSNPEDAEALANLFRRVHTMKGNTSLLLSVPINENLRAVLKDLLDVFQNMESILAKARDAKIPITSTIINLSFEAIDSLVHITTMIKKGIIANDDGKLKKLVTDMLAVGEDPALLGSTNIDVVDTVSLPNNNAPKYGRRSTDVAGGTGGNSIRVSGEKLDRLMNVIGELSITKNVFSQIARKLIMEHNLPHMSREVKDAGQFVNRISAELEDAIMAMRMTEVRLAFQKFPRIIRDVALQTGKSISLIMEGEDTELDKNIIEQIGDPLLHLVRNSGDHGIETIEERQAVGKPPQGNVWLRAYNRGKHVIIEVEDDGRGMNAEKLKRKAIEKGFITEEDAAEMSEEQAFQLVFLPGFSTAKTVTEISGRGVGMDVVRSNITALQGTIKIASQLGKGSKIMMQLPLTLMVSRGLVVEVKNQLLVMPLDNVIETVKVAADKLVRRRGQRILYHRGEVLGVVSVAEILGIATQQLLEYTPIVIVTDGQSKVAMIVDKLLNEQDILVKPLPEYLSAISGMGGATIMGDGKVALVLNPVELVQLAAR